jgi:hypothetical protein
VPQQALEQAQHVLLAGVMLEVRAHIGEHALEEGVHFFGCVHRQHQEVGLFNVLPPLLRPALLPWLQIGTPHKYVAFVHAWPPTRGIQRESA